MPSLDRVSVVASVARLCACCLLGDSCRRGFMENEVGFSHCFKPKTSFLFLDKIGQVRSTINFYSVFLLVLCKQIRKRLIN